LALNSMGRSASTNRPLRFAAPADGSTFTPSCASSCAACGSAAIAIVCAVSMLTMSPLGVMPMPGSMTSVGLFDAACVPRPTISPRITPGPMACARSDWRERM